MFEMKGITGVLYAMSEWVMRLSAINLMWFILSLPFVILLFVVDMSSKTGLAFFGGAGWLFLSFLVFPATAAVFSVTRDWIVDVDFSSVVRKYVAYLKTEYIENAKTGMAFAFAWLVWYFSYFFLYVQQSSFAFLLLLIGLALYVYTINFLCINAHFHMSRAERAKNAFFISVGRPITGLFILVSSGIMLWISVTQLFILLPILTCSMIAFLSFSAFHRVTQKVYKKSLSNNAL